MMITRRFFLLGAPAIVAASSLMPISMLYDAATVDEAMAQFLVRSPVRRPFSPTWFNAPLHPVARGLISARRFERDYSRAWNSIGIRSWANVATPREDSRQVFEAFVGPDTLNRREKFCAPQLVEINSIDDVWSRA